jgi:hypothetical protein
VQAQKAAGRPVHGSILVFLFFACTAFRVFSRKKGCRTSAKTGDRISAKTGGEIGPNWAELDLEHFGLDLSPRWREWSTRSLPGSDLAGRAARSSVWREIYPPATSSIWSGCRAGRGEQFWG